MKSNCESCLHYKTRVVKIAEPQFSIPVKRAISEGHEVQIYYCALNDWKPTMKLTAIPNPNCQMFDSMDEEEGAAMGCANTNNKGEQQ